MSESKAKPVRVLLALGMVGLGLSACQDLTARRQPVPNVPVAVESIEGVPDHVKGELASALASQASAQHVSLVPADAPAQYRLKGYLTAYPTGTGTTELSFVWDVFDEGKRRAKRIEGTSLAGATGGGNAWESLDDKAVAKVASDSMNEIAGFLVASQDAASETGSVAEEPDTDAAPRALGFSEQ